MVTQNTVFFLIPMLVWSLQVSGQGSNCPQNCALVNIAMSRLISEGNTSFTTTGNASWITDGVPSGQCASVSSLHPVWEAVLGQNRTIIRIRIFWGGPQGDVYVSVGGSICHTPVSTYTWEQNYTLNCQVPVTGNRILIYRQPTSEMLNLSFCEVEIYAVPISTSSSLSTSPTTLTPTTSTTVSTSKVTTSTSTVSSTQPPMTSGVLSSSVSGPSMANSTMSLPSNQPPSGVMSSALKLNTTTSPITTTKPRTTAQTNVVTYTAAPVTTETSTTSHAEPTTEPSGADTGSQENRFPLLYAIVVGAVAAGVVIIVGVAVVFVRRQKGKRHRAKESGEAGIPSYEMCESEPYDPTRYRIIQSNRTPRGWSDQGSIYVNTTASTSCENAYENECTYVNSEYVNDQNMSTETPCYVNVYSNNRVMDEAGESNMYVNATDFSQYENSLNIRT